MSPAALVAFGVVFVVASPALSAVFVLGLRLSAPRLRRLGPWAERRAAGAALLLPPLLALGLVATLAGHSAAALARGADHCADHGHHLHLCLAHNAAWVSRPWALALVAAAATFVAVRAGLAAWGLWGAQRAAARLRALGTRLGRRSYLLPSGERFAFTTGLFSPTIVFSTAAWEQLEPAQREAVLAHEEAHVAHGDVLSRAALALAASVGAPLLARRALRLWELSAERLCDRHAARAVGRPSTVASAMLALVQPGGPRLAPEGAVFAAGSHVAARIDSLLAGEPGGERAARVLLWALAGGVALLALAGGLFAEPLHHALETLLG